MKKLRKIYLCGRYIVNYNTAVIWSGITRWVNKIKETGIKQEVLFKHADSRMLYIFDLWPSAIITG